MHTIETPHADNAYIMGNTTAEYSRLHRQALIWEKITSRVLKEAGLQAGMNCLEAGSGTGDIMRIAGDIVGKKGTVTGMDINDEIGQESLRILKKLGNSNYSFKHADILTVDLPADHFDFVYCRFFLVHMVDPKTVLLKLFKALKPGGTLLVQDYDFAAFKTNEALKHITGYMRQITLEVFRKTGKDPEVGTNVCRYFIESGIGKPVGTDASSVITPFKDAANMMRKATTSMKPAFLQLGITTEERINQFFDDMETFGQNNSNYYVVWPMLNSAWIKK